MTPAERIAELEALVGQQRQQLEAVLAQDSHNSSNPPSSDALARKTKSMRRKSGKKRGKKPGGQLDHRGQTLRLVAEPDVVAEHQPAICTGWQAPLDAAAPVVLRARRRVQDLPPLRLPITEHQALPVQCPTCQAVTVGAFPAEAPSRAHYGPCLRALAVSLVAILDVYARRVIGWAMDRYRDEQLVLTA